MIYSALNKEVAEEFMKVQIYILGFLIRFGSQYGYKLKQLLSEYAADFARIKLPTIYYHLDKMKEKGLVSVSEEREGNKPERTVYGITEAGKKEFHKLLETAAQNYCEFQFGQDAVLYFMEFLEPAHVKEGFRKQKKNVAKVLKHIRAHQTEKLAEIAKIQESEEIQEMARLIFDHHFLHYQAELEWLEMVGKSLDGETEKRRSE